MTISLEAVAESAFCFTKFVDYISSKKACCAKDSGSMPAKGRPWVNVNKMPAKGLRRSITFHLVPV